MVVIFFLLCAIPTACELYNDRHGDTKKDHIRDVLVLTVISLGLALVLNWLFDYKLVGTMLLIWAIHFLLFDYLITYILKRNHVISPKANWFTYTGKTSTMDKYVAKIPPWIRLAIKLLTFGVTIWYVM